MGGNQGGKDPGNECKVCSIINYDRFEIKRVIWTSCHTCSIGLALLLANGGILCGIINQNLVSLL